MMNELLLATAKYMPEHIILGKMRQALDAYEKSKDPEQKKRLHFAATLFVIKESIGDDDISKIIKEFQATELVAERMNAKQ